MYSKLSIKLLRGKIWRKGPYLIFFKSKTNMSYNHTPQLIAQISAQYPMLDVSEVDSEEYSEFEKKSSEEVKNKIYLYYEGKEKRVERNPDMRKIKEIFDECLSLYKQKMQEDSQKAILLSLMDQNQAMRERRARIYKIDSSERFRRRKERIKMAYLRYKCRRKEFPEYFENLYENKNIQKFQNVDKYPNTIKYIELPRSNKISTHNNYQIKSFQNIIFPKPYNINNHLKSPNQRIINQKLSGNKFNEIISPKTKNRQIYIPTNTSNLIYSSSLNNIYKTDISHKMNSNSNFKTLPDLSLPKYRNKNVEKKSSQIMSVIKHTSEYLKAPKNIYYNDEEPLDLSFTKTSVESPKIIENNEITVFNDFSCKKITVSESPSEMLSENETKMNVKG